MKQAILTGSSSGIGKAITEHLLEQGWQVFGLARDNKRAQLTHPQFNDIPIDFSDMVHIETTLKPLGKQCDDLAAIFCCAGVGIFAELEQLAMVDMQRVMNVNFLSQAMVIKMFLPFLKRKRQGQVVVIGSEAALQGDKKGSLYCASKFALRGFCQSIRKECVSAEVGVTLINPGMVNTPFFDELTFAPGEHVHNALSVDQVVNALAWVLAEKSNCVVEEINLQPLKKVIRKVTAIDQ